MTPSATSSSVRTLLERTPFVVALILLFAFFTTKRLLAGPSFTELFVPYLLAGFLNLAAQTFDPDRGSFARLAYGALRSLTTALVPAFGLLSLKILWLWYANPGSNQLEPLFTIIGLVTAAFEAARREFLKHTSSDNEKSA